MSSGHARKGGSRASLPRRTTRGPLDGDDPLSASITPTSPRSTGGGSLNSPIGPSPNIQALDQQIQDQASLLSDSQAGDDATTQVKDLSFLLDTSIYHPLSNIDVPPPFRKPLPGVSAPGGTLAEAQSQIDLLLSLCDYLGAANVAALCLTSGLVQSTDYESIFKLLAVRFSCLELSGNVLLAAQEAKALEDLMSGFYYLVEQVSDDTVEANHGQRPVARHIMPFSLRIQALRLQNIGFSDPRRGVAALYDLGLECREHIASPYTSYEDRVLWTSNLDELSVRVVNSLIELGDLDCAVRTLEQMKPTESSKNSSWLFRTILLYTKLGQISKARTLLLETAEVGSDERSTLLSLLAIAEGRLDDASALLSEQLNNGEDGSLAALAKQNLAVTYLYAGKIAKARQMMEELVDEGFSFQSLTINLATLHDLTSDKSRDLKIALASKIASNPSPKRAFTNVDFKL